MYWKIATLPLGGHISRCHLGEKYEIGEEKKSGKCEKKRKSGTEVKSKINAKVVKVKDQKGV
jgi:hypothetical protein